MADDSISGIYKTLTDCALISKHAGGIGIHCHNVRAKGSLIRGTNGMSNGLVPMLRVFNNTARYVDQGGGKRNGSFAIYLEPWHADVELFLQMRKNHGDEELKARDLFYAIWMPDLFMERVKVGGTWTLMCPDECPGLSDVYGDEFKQLYEQYEANGKGRTTMNARDLWFQILDAQMETGTPYLVYKDASNIKSNQKNIGTIKSSNLCTEVLLYSDDKETAVCFTGDTQILTKEGYRRIDDCDGKEVLSYFNNDTEFKETQEFTKASLINNGEKKVYELECYGRKKIKVTENHLFAVIEKRNYDKKINTYKWKKLTDLNKDDRIAFPKTNPLPNHTNKIFENVDENYLTVGWLLGDGWQCKKTKSSEKLVYGACFGPNEIYARDRVITKLNEWLDNAEFEKMGNNKKTADYYTDKRTGVFSWVSSKTQFIKNIQENFGLMPHTAHYKVIPDKIKIASPSQKASFLSGLFSADGNVFITNKNDRVRFNINLASSSKPLLDDVQNMLKEFGIESLIVFGDVKNRPNKQGKVSIENKDSVANFYKYINFVLCKEKQDTLEYGMKTIKKKEMFTGFTKIKSVKYVGIEKVYDLNVPNTHNFIAEGFVVHNCNLASIALPAFIEPNTQSFDYTKLHEITKVVTYNLNKVIDINYYPTDKTRRSNMRHHPIGIGVQGLADIFMMLNLPFDSDEAKKINHDIFETIYHAALEQSCELAMEEGPYETFAGSPASQGILQFDMWNVDPGSTRYDWTSLKQKIMTHGIRNSTLLAPMPTASTSQILGYNECIEPITSNIYSRRTIAGEFIMANKYLMADLLKLDLWNEKIKNNIIANNGSIQHIDIIPEDIRMKYRTVWEIPMKSLIDMAADRGAYICQSQSLNLWLEDPNYNTLTSMHFYGWKKGLKTGIYYLRRRGAHKAQQFTIEAEKKQDNNNIMDDEDDGTCLMCSA
jgi:ribonucleoside-diphosphate reductase alpha chain